MGHSSWGPVYCTFLFVALLSSPINSIDSTEIPAAADAAPSNAAPSNAVASSAVASSAVASSAVASKIDTGGYEAQDASPLDYMIQFSVTPSNCTVSPDPYQKISNSRYKWHDITANYFTVYCPAEFSSAVINFPANRVDDKVIVSGEGYRAQKNVTTIKVLKSKTSKSHPFVQLKNLHLCNVNALSAPCKDFEISVSFSQEYPPLIEKIHILNGPRTFVQPFFSPQCEVYPVELFANVPVIFGLQSQRQHRIFVDSTPVVAKSSSGFISSSKFMTYRPRAAPGSTENVTVYAATYDQSSSRPYTIMIKTIASQEARLRSLSISSGRLEPEFSTDVYSYYARVAPGLTKYSVTLEGLDDVNTRCLINQDPSTAILGHGYATVHMPRESQSGAHTIVIDCTSQDGSDTVRYTLGLVPQKGGSTSLSDLDIVGAQLDRPFDPLNHGPYLANLELQRHYDQGWVAFTGHTVNPRASMTVEYLPFNSSTGMSPWFRVEKGEFRRFRIAVRTPENPVEEQYFVHVDRRGRCAPAFLQNMHLMQFLSVSSRINGQPETYDSFGEGFNKWNLQWDVPFISKPASELQLNSSGIDLVVPPESDRYIINANQKKSVDVVKSQAAALLSSLSSEFHVTTANGKWAPAIDLSNSAVAAIAANHVETSIINTFAESENSVIARRRLSAFSTEDKLLMIKSITAAYKQHAAIRDYISSIIGVTVVLGCVAGLYAIVTKLCVDCAIKSKDRRVRDMPKILHPIRFWSFVFDIVLIAFAQACFGILSCPTELRNSEFIVFGFIQTTPKLMMWFAGLILLLFPFAYLGLIGWVLYSLKDSAIYSKDLSRYHKKDLFVAKAESSTLPWLPFFSSLFAIEIRDAFPIFRPGDEEIDDELKERPPIEFSEDRRSGGPCNVDAPEFGLPENQSDAISRRNKTGDQHYFMVPKEQSENRIRYHASYDELKVSLGGLRSSHASDSDNAPIYNKYPDAEVGRKCFKVKNPYGFEMDCHALLQMKHLSNLWQMSELPHHFHFWIPRKNCQMNDFDGWNNLFDKSHRGNFFYYLIDRVVFLAIVGIIVCGAETSGLVTGFAVAAVSLVLAGVYTPSAIASGTSKWYSQMEEELRLREKEARFEESEKKRQAKWPFDDSAAKQRVLDLQREREALDACGHGGWFARHRDFGISQLSFWHHRWYFCFREWITGAPGLELAKCLVLATVTLGNASYGGLGNAPASTLAIIFACLGSICLNFDSLVGLYRKLRSFCSRLSRSFRLTAIWIYEASMDSAHIVPRFVHFFKTCGNHLLGIHTSFDFPDTVGERIRDFKVKDCVLIADEVGLQFCGPVKPSDMTTRLQERIGNRHSERYELTKTLYMTGPIGSHRPNVDDSFPVRLPFRDFYLGKLTQTQGVAATIHIVNHGFRCQLKDPKVKNVFTGEDDSYLSLYRDPRYLPEWGVVRTGHSGHGYVIQYDHETHILMVKGPSLKEGVEYRVKTDRSLNKKDENDEESMVSERSENEQCIGQAVCTSSGLLYVQGKAPSLYHPIEIQSPDGDGFTINPTDVKVHYDPVSKELTLRHRLLIETNERSPYRVVYTAATVGTPINEVSTCLEPGILHVKLSNDRVPDLKSIITFNDSSSMTFTADPKDTNAHRVALPIAKEARGIGLVLSRLYARLVQYGRQIVGCESLRDTVEAMIPCTVVQCVNPTLGQYRIEPDFRDAMRTIRAQIHSLEAQRSQLDNVDRLATSWHSVMSKSEFCAFWLSHNVNVIPAQALWVDPLRDFHEPLVKNQYNKIEAAVPAFRTTVHRLFTDRIKELEAELHTLSLWVRAYDDVNLYGAQLQKDLAEVGGYNASTGLAGYVKKIRSFKQQYEAQMKNFVYPFVIEERHITRMPNISAQLRQWQRQLAVWFRAEEDAPLMSSSFVTPRSVVSSNNSSNHRLHESGSLERTVMEVMYALKDNINRCEDLSSGQYRSVLHYVTDSLNVRGPYTNWRPDPIGGHVALVRVWYPKEDGTPDFQREPVWNPCCIKLSANAVKILLPGKDDVDFRFSTPYYWSHVLGHSIQLDCLETLEVSHHTTLPVGHASNLMLKGMPGQLVCRLTSALPHVGDQHIRLVENGASGQEILMRRDGAQEDEDLGSSPRSSEGDAFLISLGKRMTPNEAKSLPTEEVRIVNNSSAQAFPLTFRFGERFIAKWAAVIASAQMNKEPLDIDDQFGLPESERSESVNPIEVPSEISSSLSSASIPSERSSSTHLTLNDDTATYEGEWQNYRYHGKGRLVDANGGEVYSGEWLDGKRWGKGRYTFRDTKGLLWQYEGEFKDDEFCGKGHVTLIDEQELQRLRLSKDPKDRHQIIDFIGEVRGPITRSRRRGYTAPLNADKPSLHPAVLEQLFLNDPSYDAEKKPLVIDIRRTISSAVGDMKKSPDLMSQGSSVDDSRELYETAKDEYLPHRSRWSRSLDPSLGFESLEARLVAGTARYSNGAVYQGTFHNGHANGKGRYMTADQSIRCEGNWSKGLPHGYAVLTEKTSDGKENSYFGSFVNGKRSGHGIQTAKDGAIYVEGQWTDDAIINSEETLINVQPDATSGKLVRYTGPVVNGLPEGEGKVKWRDDVNYRGNFSNGIRTGQGVMRDANNRVLVSSNWKNDAPHGRVSRVVQADGKVYTGDMLEGKRQGMGELYHSEKGEPFFEGLWVNDMADGRGTLYTEDGTYDGEFKEGKRHGKGTFEYTKDPSAKGDPRLYVGDWKNDLPHGLGKYRNDLGAENTYKFNKGQLDKSSVTAYKNGMCGKVPLIGASPSVISSEVDKSANTNYGPQREMNAVEFRRLLSDSVTQPLWSRCVENRSMEFIDLGVGPSQAVRPAAAPPSRPLSSDFSQILPVDFQTESPVRRRYLQVTVIRGKDLPTLDRQTKPYVKATIGKELKKTEIVENGGASPQWGGEALNFHLKREKKVLIEVWDQDLSTKDRFLASGETDLMSFLNSNSRESDIIEIPVFRPSGPANKDEPAGTISVRLSIIERPKLSVSESSEGSASANLRSLDSSVLPVPLNAMGRFIPGTDPSPFPPPYIHIRVHSGQNLTNMDVLKNMDPYVEVTMGGMTKTTKVQKLGGVDPKFDEEFYMPYNGEPRITFKVFDKDVLKSDDLVGRAEVSLPVASFMLPTTLYRPNESNRGNLVEAGVLFLSINTVLP